MSPENFLHREALEIPKGVNGVTGMVRKKITIPHSDLADGISLNLGLGTRVDVARQNLSAPEINQIQALVQRLIEKSNLLIGLPNVQAETERLIEALQYSVSDSVKTILNQAGVVLEDLKTSRPREQKIYSKIASELKALGVVIVTYYDAIVASGSVAIPVNLLGGEEEKNTITPAISSSQQGKLGMLTELNGFLGTLRPKGKKEGRDIN
jgi:hypothetical protein